jgi:hypothetical protein
MTLATILFVCILCSAVSGELTAVSPTVASLISASPSECPAGQTPAPEPPQAALASNQDTPSSSQSVPGSPTTPAPPVSSPAQVSSEQEKAKAPKRKRRKKTANANCAPSAEGKTPAGGATATATAPTSGAPDSNSPANGKQAPAKCPPEKKIVHDGGTTEPAIQLLGGPGGEQASHQRDTTDQLLGSVEDNLKKVAGRQLNSSQQEMVNQIHQFIEQSKAAVATGDMERGHNLAMKAHLLSAELVKP